MSTTVSTDAFIQVGAGGRPVKPRRHAATAFHARGKPRASDKKAHQQARKSFATRGKETKGTSGATKLTEVVVLGGGFGGSVRGRERVMGRLREISHGDSDLLALIDAETKRELAKQAPRAEREESKRELEVAPAPAVVAAERRDSIALAVMEIARPFVEQQKLVADLKPIILAVMEAARLGADQPEDATVDALKDILFRKFHKELAFLTAHLAKPKPGRARSKTQIALRAAYREGVKNSSKGVLRHLLNVFKLVFRDDSGIDLPTLKRLLLKTPAQREGVAMKTATKMELGEHLDLYSTRITAANRAQTFLKLFFCSELTSSLFSPQPAAARAPRRTGTFKDFVYPYSTGGAGDSNLMTLRFSQKKVSATIRAGRERSMTPQNFARLIKRDSWNKAHRILVVNRASTSGEGSYEQTFDNRRVRAVVLACRNAEGYTSITDASVPALVVSGAAPVGLFPDHLVARALDVFKHYLTHNRGSKFSIDMTDEQAAEYIKTISWSQLIALRQNTFGTDSEKLVAQAREGYRQLPSIEST